MERGEATWQFSVATCQQFVVSFSTSNILNRKSSIWTGHGRFPPECTAVPGATPCASATSRHKHLFVLDEWVLAHTLLLFAVHKNIVNLRRRFSLQLTEICTQKEVNIYLILKKCHAKYIHDFGSYFEIKGKKS